MLSQSQKDAMVQVVGFAIVLYLAGFAVLRLARFARGLTLSKCTLNPMHWWRLCTKPAEQDDDKIRERVAREVGETCCKLTISVAKASMVMCVVTLVAMIRNIRSGQTRFTNAWQDLAFVVLTLVTTIMATVPCLVRPKTLVPWYAASMICISLGVLSADTYEDAIYISSFWLLPRVALAVAHGQVLAATFWNVVCFSCSFYAYLDRSNASKAQGIDNSYLNRRTLTLDFMYFCVVVYGTTLAKRALWAYVHSVVQSSTLSGESSAMKEILYLVCDVAVELDSDLAFVEDDPKFAAFLTLAPGREIKGRSFKEFLPAEPDREIFDERVRSASENENIAQPGALHTSLRDGWGNHINVEVFFVQFDSGDLSKHYFVGFREFDNQPLANLPQTRSQGGSHRRPGHSQASGVQGIGTPAVVNQQSIEDDTSSVRSADSASSKGSAARGSELALPEALPTHETAMQISLSLLMSTWNVQRRAVVCCPFHAHLEYVQRACKRLARANCHQGFKAKGSGQCTTCGILVPDQVAGKCPTCNLGEIEELPCAGRASL